jgi:hypothetical protein
MKTRILTDFFSLSISIPNAAQHAGIKTMVSIAVERRDNIYLNIILQFN